MDGVPGIGAGNIEPGKRTVYEFDASPFGVHLYHCHSTPLAEHIAKGVLDGAMIIDPKDGRPPADELVMNMTCSTRTSTAPTTSMRSTRSRSSTCSARSR